MLLSNIEFSSKLFQALERCDSLIACAAFIKLKALQDEQFISNLINKDVTIIARWQKHDLVFGASDLEVYELCKQRGWKFGIDLNLHGKLFLVDDEIFLGSANLTQRGLHIGLVGNNEFGTRIPAGDADLHKIEQFIDSEVTWINDELYESIKGVVENTSKQEAATTPFQPWPDFIAQQVVKPVENLWVQELVFCSPADLLHMDLNNENAVHDYELLGLNIDDISTETLKRSFRRLRLYRWLRNLLIESSLSFGKLTAALHRAIIDDPKPYRLDIKNYNQTLFKWAEFLSEDFVVNRPNYSQILSLKE